MRQGPHVKRQRGRGQGQGGGQGNGGGGGSMNNGGQRRQNVPLRHQTFDSNGPEVRVRGNAFQVYEKYLALARDASSAGDRIAAENYFQHAEHYYRIINANNDGQPYASPTPRDGYEGDEQAGGNAQPVNGGYNGNGNGHGGGADHVQANGNGSGHDEQTAEGEAESVEPETPHS